MLHLPYSATFSPRRCLNVGTRHIPACTKGVKGQTMTHVTELCAMSLNIKTLTYEPELPVKVGLFQNQE